MIRTLLAQESGLACGALAFVLAAESDVEVVATVGDFAEMVQLAQAHEPDAVVLDLELLPADELPRLGSLQRAVGDGAMLILVEARKSHLLGDLMARQSAGFGFVAKDGPPGRLVSALRRAVGGEPFLDPELVISALRHDSPLTVRETEVLRVAAEGLPVKEIAQRLVLAPGTVRNHLSRVISKARARTTIEAVKIAEESGWI